MLEKGKGGEEGRRWEGGMERKKVGRRRGGKVERRDGRTKTVWMDRQAEE